MYLRHNPIVTTKASDWPQKWFKDKACKCCGTMFAPVSPCNLYCSTECSTSGQTSAYLKRNYGIDYKEYCRLLECQDRKCAICGGEGFVMAQHHKLKLVVDHDHKTGKVRGLLCHNCNRGLGLFKDDLETLTNAHKYLLTV